MHMQIRCQPVLSPPDVKKLLGFVTEAGVNLVAVGGSDVEFGGEFAFVPEEKDDDPDNDVIFNKLKEVGYDVRKVFVTEEGPLFGAELANTPGALFEFISSIADRNIDDGRIIRDLLIGVPDERMRGDNLVPVHVYCEQVRTAANAS